MTSLSNPTNQLVLNFQHYLSSVEQTNAQRSANGVPSYAFSLDNQLRQKISRVRIVCDLARAMTSMAVPEAKQQFLVHGVAVGSNQYPAIQALGEECARHLHIGVPQIFIYHELKVNAFTIATDDLEPIVVLTSGLVEAMNERELKFVIGHECGHIHNLHSVYNLAAEMLINPVMRQLLGHVARAGIALNLIQTIKHVQLLTSAVQGGLRLFFMHWQRCAEFTCDRAGLICVGDLAVAQRALAKLVVGGAQKLAGFNIDEYLNQLSGTTLPTRFNELFQSHPLIPRRMEALRIYANCQTLFDWRPDLMREDGAISHHEADQRCEDIINVFSHGREGQG